MAFKEKPVADSQGARIDMNKRLLIAVVAGVLFILLSCYILLALTNEANDGTPKDDFKLTYAMVDPVNRTYELTMNASWLNNEYGLDMVVWRIYAGTEMNDKTLIWEEYGTIITTHKVDAGICTVKLRCHLSYFDEVRDYNHTLYLK